jgi:DNA-directed RNA polymerase I, II, and III subunit RPABC1
VNIKIYFQTEENYKMEKAYEICIEMIEQRGYKIVDSDNERILAVKADNSQMCVFVVPSHKFNVETIQEYISMMKKMNLSHCIIVIKDNATPIAKKIIDESPDLDIELFYVDELQYNITKHYLVPKHELAYKKGTADYTAFKKKFMADNFPVILKSDVVARFYAFQKGDIIKITRPNGLITYRIVK